MKAILTFLLCLLPSIVQAQIWTGINLCSNTNTTTASATLTCSAGLTVVTGDTLILIASVNGTGITVSSAVDDASGSVSFTMLGSQSVIGAAVRMGYILASRSGTLTPIVTYSSAASQSHQLLVLQFRATGTPSLYSGGDISNLSSGGTTTPTTDTFSATGSSNLLVVAGGRSNGGTVFSSFTVNGGAPSANHTASALYVWRLDNASTMTSTDAHATIPGSASWTVAGGIFESTAAGGGGLPPNSQSLMNAGR